MAPSVRSTRRSRKDTTVPQRHQRTPGVAPVHHTFGARFGAIPAVLVAIVTLASGCTNSSGDAGTTEKGLGSGAPEEFGLTLALLAIRVEQTEQLIGSCMQAAGFEYIPIDFSTIKEAMEADQTAPGLSDDEYIKQFGLGITTQFDKPIVTFRAGETNNTHVESLAGTDRRAFERALWGEASDWNHVRALEEEDFSQSGGCTRSAATETYQPGELSGSYVNPADKRIESDPRVIAATAQWADCMRAEGFEYTNPSAVEDDLLQQLDEVTQGKDPRTLAEPALGALEELQGRELAIAALLKSCDEEHLEPIVATVEAEFYGSRST